MDKKLAFGLAGILAIATSNTYAFGFGDLAALAGGFAGGLVGDNSESSVTIKNSTISTDVTMGNFTNVCEGLLCKSSNAIGGIAGGKTVELDNSTFNSRVAMGSFENRCSGISCSSQNAIGGIVVK